MKNITHLTQQIITAMSIAALLCVYAGSCLRVFAETADADPPATDSTLDAPPDDETPEPHLPDLVIAAFNPGYKIDGVADTNEFILLANQSAASLDLTGYALTYTNGSGKTVTLTAFPDGSLLDGDTLLLRYIKSPDSDLSHLTYTPSLALSAGPLTLTYHGEPIDSICWTGKTDCAKAFKSTSPTSLVRDLDTGEFVHDPDFLPEYDQTSLYQLPPPDISEDPVPTDQDPLEPEPALEEPADAPKCRALIFTEVYSYYADSAAEQFIELYNSGDDLDLSGCAIGYKKKSYPLSGTVPASGYFAYSPQDFSLTKNPTTSNQITLIDADGQIVDELIYPHGQKKSTSYAQFFDSSGTETWLLTYSPTPGAPNTYQEFRTCPEGKVINPLTGNCVNNSSLSTALADCPAGKYRNPLTGRCKNLDTTTSTELKPCAEGYERNPVTNRCRKITSGNDGADYALVPVTRSDGGKTFTALGLILLIVALGVGYIVLQFRHEIARTGRKLRQRLHDIREHHISWPIRRHRDKDP